MEQRQVKYPLGSLSSIQAESIGEPGQRTFHLILESRGARYSVWLEKEQLFQLGIYLQEVVQSLSAEDLERQSQPVEPEWSGEGATIDFKAGQLMLSHDPSGNSFYLLAYEQADTESEVETPPEEDEATSISFSISMAQAETLAEEALRICAAGRPSCFLCGLPVNPDGHVCPRSNGHTLFELG